MLVSRWQAPLVPEKRQIYIMFEAEGLEAFEEVFHPQKGAAENRHPFDEVIMVAEGQLLLDIAGNRLLLRPGDKIVIPANTRHSKQADGDTPCTCICAKQVY